MLLRNWRHGRTSSELAELANKTITLRRDCRLEVIELLRRPIRLLHNSVGYAARKSNVQHIRLIVPVIASDARAETLSCERYTGLADERRTVVTVCVAPDSVYLLQSVSSHYLVVHRVHTNLSPHSTAITLSGLSP